MQINAKLYAILEMLFGISWWDVTPVGLGQCPLKTLLSPESNC